MNRREFISGLKEALELKVDDSEINAQVEYYEGYIKGEVKSGRKEKDVIEELGDPWAIAKNLAYETQSTLEDAKDQGYANNSKDRAPGRMYTTNSKWVMWGIFFLIIAVIFTVISIMLGILNFLSPILVPLLIISMVYRIFKR